MQKLINKGAEAIILDSNNKRITKKRISKNYRDPILDKKLIKTRNKQEATLLKRARLAGINTPVVYSVSKDSIVMEKIENTEKHKALAKDIGKEIAKLHALDIIHGDLNLINILTTKGKKIYFIDFGLGFLSRKAEDKATDLLVFKKTLLASKKTEKIWKGIVVGYKNKEILEKIREIEKRGRYL